MTGSNPLPPSSPSAQRTSANSSITTGPRRYGEARARQARARLHVHAVAEQLEVVAALSPGLAPLADDLLLDRRRLDREVRDRRHQRRSSRSSTSRTSPSSSFTRARDVLHRGDRLRRVLAGLLRLADLGRSPRFAAARSDSTSGSSSRRRASRRQHLVERGHRRGAARARLRKPLRVAADLLQVEHGVRAPVRASVRVRRRRSGRRRLRRPDSEPGVALEEHAPRPRRPCPTTMLAGMIAPEKPPLRIANRTSSRLSLRTSKFGPLVRSPAATVPAGLEPRASAALIVWQPAQRSWKSSAPRCRSAWSLGGSRSRAAAAAGDERREPRAGEDGASAGRIGGAYYRRAAEGACPAMEK